MKCPAERFTQGSNAVGDPDFPVSANERRGKLEDGSRRCLVDRVETQSDYLDMTCNSAGKLEVATTNASPDDDYLIEGDVEDGRIVRLNPCPAAHVPFADRQRPRNSIAHHT